MIFGAEHLGEDARGMDLRRIRRRQVAKLGLRLEGDPQKTAVQVHKDTLAFRPHRIACVIGDIGLRHNAEHLAKTIDQEMIAMVLLHYRDDSLPDALQPCVFLRRKARLIAFGGVIDDARRLRTPLGLGGVNGSALIYRIKDALLIRLDVAIVHPQSIAVHREIVSLIHQPDIWDYVLWY